MDKKYPESELTKYSKKDIISLFMSMQKLTENLSMTCAEQKAQLEQVYQNLNLILEHMRISKHQKLGRSSEKMIYNGQLEMCFNEAEVTIVNKYVVEPEMEESAKNHIIDGAKASAIIYSIAETAKANNLKPYNYFEFLLTEIPKRMEDTDLDFSGQSASMV